MMPGDVLVFVQPAGSGASRTRLAGVTGRRALLSCRSPMRTWRGSSPLGAARRVLPGRPPTRSAQPPTDYPCSRVRPTEPSARPASHLLGVHSAAPSMILPRGMIAIIGGSVCASMIGAGGRACVGQGHAITTVVLPVTTGRVKGDAALTLSRRTRNTPHPCKVENPWMAKRGEAWNGRRGRGSS